MSPSTWPLETLRMKRPNKTKGPKRLLLLKQATTWQRLGFDERHRLIAHWATPICSTSPSLGHHRRVGRQRKWLDPSASAVSALPAQMISIEIYCNIEINPVATDRWRLQDATSRPVTTTSFSAACGIDSVGAAPRRANRCKPTRGNSADCNLSFKKKKIEKKKE